MKRRIQYLLVYACKGNLRKSLQCCPVLFNKEIVKISELGYEVKLIPCFCHGNIALKAIQRPLHDILSKVYEIFVIAYPVYICLENYITRQKPVMPVFKKPPVILSSLWPGKVIAAFYEIFVIAYPVYICLENYITRQKPVMPVFKKPPVILSSLWPGKVIAAFSELPDPVYVLFLEMVKIELSIRRFAQHIPVLYPLSETATRLYVKIECGIS